MTGRNFFRFVLFSVLFLPVFFDGCSSFNTSKNESWAPGEIEAAKGSIKIVSVSVERSGEKNYSEKEIFDLLPLLFSEKSFIVVSPDGEADYFAEVKAREREYADDWRSKRSSSVEVRLWKAGEIGVLPLSAGRAIIQGNQTLSSSITMTRMLRRAVKEALAGLQAAEKKK